MKQVAFVTCERRPAIAPDDRAAAVALEARGVRVRAVPWSDETTSWREVDALVVRSTWDYHLRAASFLAWVAARRAQGVPLFNSPETLLWNVDKRYLLELEEQGVQVVPTCRVGAGDLARLRSLLGRPAFADAVVKPAVSASAHGTFRVRGARLPRQVERIGRRQDVLVQPFVEEVVGEGEWSLVFFEGAFSHAVLKRPAAGDFRVQADFGGDAEPRAPPEGLVAAAQRALALAPAQPLYARVDGVLRDGQLLLMELELIEPRLYFQGRADAANRFAAALLRRLEEEQASRWRG